MHGIWPIILALTLFSGLPGCTADNEFAQKQVWLEQNYPDRRQSVKQLPAPRSQFTQQIIAGKIVKGMRLEEVYIATDSYPYGPKSVNTVFWCVEQEVAECDSKCNVCNSITLTHKLAILLSSESGLLRVTEHRKRGEKEPIELYQGVHFSLARHTYRVMGNRNAADN